MEVKYCFRVLIGLKQVFRMSILNQSKPWSNTSPPWQTVLCNPPVYGLIYLVKYVGDFSYFIGLAMAIFWKQAVWTETTLFASVPVIAMFMKFDALSAIALGKLRSQEDTRVDMERSLRNDTQACGGDFH
jgi:hypothetical protein